MSQGYTKLTLYLKQFPFFQNKDFCLQKIQFTPNVERVFLMQDLETKENYKVRINTNEFKNSANKELAVINFLSQFPK